MLSNFGYLFSAQKRIQNSWNLNRVLNNNSLTANFAQTLDMPLHSTLQAIISTKISALDIMHGSEYTSVKTTPHYRNHLFQVTF